MAKVQDLTPNPMRISGACGRLLCCLKYEHPLYVDFGRSAPALGARVSTEAGEGVVVGHQVPADGVVVRLRDPGATMSCSRSSVCGSRQAYEGRPAAESPES
jgi:cell fate regulator YaaT (PSP1 superfamily)